MIYIIVENLYKLEQEKINSLKILSKEEKKYLNTPKREISFTIPLKMDNGAIKIFKAYRIQHNDVLGPYKGGIRFQKDVDINTVRALSMWMTWKCTIANLPLGGSKGAIDCDVNKLSQNEQELLCRGYMRAIHENIGVNKDIPAPDIGTNGKHMIYMLDEYEKIKGEKLPGVITGKPVGLGGSLGRNLSTGYGAIYVLKKYLEINKYKMNDMSASIQGFGEAGEAAASLFSDYGGKVKGISFYHTELDKVITIYNKEKINIEELIHNKDSLGNIDLLTIKNLGHTILDGEEWYKLNVDILIPAALENQLGKTEIENTSEKLKLICEIANGPTTKDGDLEAKKKGIFIIPDIVANSGGVTCSYFEQIQNNSNYYWEEKEVLDKLEKSMVKAFMNIYEETCKTKKTMREISFEYCIKKIINLSKIKRWI